MTHHAGTSSYPSSTQLSDAEQADAEQPAVQQPFAVLVVCSGNICRSPMGEHVLRRAVADAGLSPRVTVSSAGTGDWHVGQPAHDPAQRILAEAGYPTEHVARHVTRDMVDASDLVLAADHGHYLALRELASDLGRVRLLRSFDPAADGDEVPDPYGDSDDSYLEVLAMLKAAAPGIVDEIRLRL